MDARTSFGHSQWKYNHFDMQINYMLIILSQNKFIKISHKSL